MWEWHDLKRDMADLPEDYLDKWVISTHGIYYVAFYDQHLGVWIGGGSFDLPVRAWCELPRFEEGEK